MTRNLSNLLLLAALFLILCAPGKCRAGQDYDNCAGFITSVPAVINTPGIWCLKQDFAMQYTSGDAITINANNVVIDCNGFSIDNRAAGPSTSANGVYASDRRNETVRNCHILGFNFGVLIDQGSIDINAGHVVEDNFFEANFYGAIGVVGDGSIIRRNRILNTGGSVLNPGSLAISATGSVDILDNSIRSNSPGANGIGSGQNSGGTISGNLIRGVSPVYDFAVYGINASGTPTGHPILRNNDLSGNGAPSTEGITCEGQIAARVSDNIIGGFAYPLAGCGDAGGNDITP